MNLEEASGPSLEKSKVHSGLWMFYDLQEMDHPRRRLAA